MIIKDFRCHFICRFSRFFQKIEGRGRHGGRNPDSPLAGQEWPAPAGAAAWFSFWFHCVRIMASKNQKTTMICRTLGVDDVREVMRQDPALFFFAR